ncbi:Pga1p LALA0_S04e02080g [Lachancea lanzarotensis]|uniref:LALA0S04e02080g1_1 n=1 Tax=Lachancea lanzarotensis TaxID=1245769 RepID=A0A0C7N5H3_9SACH|nr:uncharacterized protein LALA0_S04e02080g [Lachancea lanzarotensis]CEP61848.1 LALA0S04e02080g1_1 [Lachancea lanzarotensis]
MTRRRMVSTFILELLTIASLILANTETLFFKVPSTFRSESSEYDTASPHLSLVNTNRGTKEFDIPIGSTFGLELHGLEPGDTYQAKFCWTAADPVDVRVIGWALQRKKGSPSSKDLINVVNVELVPFSYPAIKTSTVPVIVSVAAVRLGLPVDLYSTLLYITLVFAATYGVYRHFLRSIVW